MTSAPSAPRPVTPVSILAGQLEALSAALDAVDGVGDDLRADLRRACALAGGLDPYVARCTTPESPALARLAARTREADWGTPGSGESGPQLEAEMLTGHVEGQVLKFLVRLSGARRVLELGMFTGYSALAMAEALPHDGEVVACELDADVARFAQRCFDESPSGHKIAVRVAPGLTTLEELAGAGEVFDLAFVDADKTGYLGYLTTLLDRGLVAPDGLICVDNTLLQGEPYASDAPTAGGAAIRAFNSAVADDPRLEQVLLPLRDGLTLIRLV